MWPDQWLMQKVAKVLFWRYQGALKGETHKWNALAERHRREQLTARLGSRGIDIVLRDGVQIIAPENVHFGNHIAIGSFSMLRGNGGISLADYVLIGDYVVLATAGHPVDGLHFGHSHEAPISLHENVWVGANALILPGVTIGENAIIGAGAVVTGDVPANSIAVGVPAVVKKEVDIDPAALDAQKSAMQAQRLKKNAHMDARDVF